VFSAACTELLAGVTGLSLQMLVWCFFATFTALILGTALRHTVMCEAVVAQPLLFNDIFT